LDALIGIITWFISETNYVLDFIFCWGGLFVILGYPVYFFAEKIRKFDKQSNGGEILFQTLILTLAMMVTGLIWLLPELIHLKWPVLLQKWPDLIWFATAIRLAELSLVLFFFAYEYGYKNGDGRWLQSFIGHFVLVFFGLYINNWVGILFISLPILVAYYCILYRLALVILPTSDPDDNAERWKRFVILAAYTWGIQFPLIVVDGNGWNKTETRIPGDFTWDYPVPGLIWNKSHQVVAITAGIKFKRIDGPGLVFTGKMERPEQIFDLRIQLRTNEIDVVSKDGVSFKARVFTAFRLDPETWDKETYDLLRPMNTILRGADIPNYTKGSFPYSSLRVQAALGVTSTKATADNSIIYWDQWALSVVEDQARKVISQKNLDELWRPSDDKKGANALDKIADEIKKNVYPIFRSAGILVLGSRIVNFNFPKKEGQTIDEISEQQLATWSSEGERKRAQALDTAKATSELAQQSARAYAESLLLDSIADGIQKAKAINDKLPRYVIAMRFLSSLLDYAHKQPKDEEKIRNLENKLKEWQDLSFKETGKEK
jgi:regulator of protease activity HflC (stomatin/prohibitin superfamily)